MTAARCVSIQRVDRDIAGHCGRGERPTSSPLPTSPASLTRRPNSPALLGLDQTVRVEHVTVNEGGQAIVARAAYARVRPLYKRLAQEVRHILETKLADAGLTTVSITDRPKDIDSFAAPAGRASGVACNSRRVPRP
jgi:hypothetical protein